MVFPATERYGLVPAPGGLGLVQDLLNTHRSPRGTFGDLLASVGSAQAWAGAAVAEWASVEGRRACRVRLRATDVDALRTLRDQLGDPASEAPPLLAGLSVVAGNDAAGRLVLEPAGTGWQVVAGAVLLGVHRAQRRDEWRRLKTCRSPICRAVFYDRSRNNSGVWHDVRACGNAINLRASRARRSQTAGSEAGA